MSIPDHLASAHSPLHQSLGIEIEEVTAQYARGRMPVTGNTQVFGVLHGGASCAFIEGLASLAALAAAGPGGKAFGVDLNATHHRTVTDGWVTGEATALYIGRSTATYDVVLRDEEGERICTGRLTCALRRPAEPADRR